MRQEHSAGRCTALDVRPENHIPPIDARAERVERSDRERSAPRTRRRVAIAYDLLQSVRADEEEAAIDGLRVYENECTSTGRMHRFEFTDLSAAWQRIACLG